MIAKIITAGGIAALLLLFFLHMHEVQQPTTTVARPQFNRQLRSIDNPSSVWAVVNKQRPLQPINYAPTDLATPHFLLTLEPNDPNMMVRREAAEALGTMYDGAKRDGIYLLLGSGYRSLEQQKQTQASLIDAKGIAEAERESARSGYSEHQTGLAADIGVKGANCLIEECFADTEAGKWVAANSYKYGFIIRYPKGKEAVTGYEYEPWHVRYVGEPLAKEMHRTHVTTLEEFFKLPAAPNY